MQCGHSEGRKPQIFTEKKGILTKRGLVFTVKGPRAGGGGGRVLYCQAAKSTHHLNKIDDQHCECETGGEGVFIEKGPFFHGKGASRAPQITHGPPAPGPSPQGGGGLLKITVGGLPKEGGGMGGGGCPQKFGDCRGINFVRCVSVEPFYEIDPGILGRGTSNSCDQWR